MGKYVVLCMAMALMLAGCDTANDGGPGGTVTPGQDTVQPGVDTTSPAQDTSEPITTNPNGAIVADHTVVAAYDSLPTQIIHDVMASTVLYYGHTSHGSQIVTGMAMLQDADHDYNNGEGTLTLVEPGGDLGHTGDLTWETTTRAYLDSEEGAQTTMVMWSWCGGCSDNTYEGIQTYLDAMNQLEIDYPGITFVYMTGHTDGSGEDGTLRTNNQQIRDYCTANSKLLFDFEDIESWDPAGTYYPDISDDCAWCSTWCETNDCPECGSCAHSHCFNCYQKGKAFWWLMARIGGWNGA